MLVQKNVEDFLSSEPDLGANLAYDGIFWDGLGGCISWLGSDIDSNLDGRPDDPNVLDAAYRAGVEELLAQVRACLPHAILLGNGAPRGLCCLGSTAAFMRRNCHPFWTGSGALTWDAVADRLPRMDSPSVNHRSITTLFGAPEAIYWEKHSSESSAPHPAGFPGRGGRELPAYALWAHQRADGGWALLLMT